MPGDREHCRAMRLLPFVAAAVHRRHRTDHLLANELHASRLRSSTRVKGFPGSYEVDAGRRRCCTFLLYRRPPVVRGLILTPSMRATGNVLTRGALNPATFCSVDQFRRSMEHVRSVRQNPYSLVTVRWMSEICA